MSYLFRRIISSREEPGIKLIVFDFDGTLADTRELMLRIIKKHLIAFEISLTKDLIAFFGNTPLDHYLKLVGLPSDLVRSVCVGIHDDFSKEYHKIKPCKNLMTVKNIKTKKVILTNNVTFFVEKALNFLNANFFDGVYGSDKFSPNNKVWMIDKLRKKYGLSRNEIVYVGDKDVDVDVARAAGVYSTIVSNKSSWSPRKAVLIKKPDYLLTDLSKVSNVIGQINSEQLSSI
ncbi:MAG: HAD hydrolase-like protein [Nanoarchaeota archaeon]